MIAVYPSAEAGFSNAPLKALLTLHTPTDYSPGWPPTTRKGLPAEGVGQAHRLPPPLQPQGVPSWEPVCRVDLQPRKTLYEGLVYTQFTHPPPSEMPQQRPAHASPPGREARLPLHGPHSGARTAEPKVLTSLPAGQTAHAPLRRKPK